MVEPVAEVVGEIEVERVGGEEGRRCLREVVGGMSGRMGLAVVGEEAELDGRGAVEDEVEGIGGEITEICQ